MEEPISEIDPIQPDPLLKPGAFIDPNPSSNGKKSSKRKSTSTVDSAALDTSQPSDQKNGVTSNGKKSSSTVDPDSASVDASQPSDQKGEIPATPRPDWLPSGWTFVERVRASGASAGSRDKYYVDPVTQRRFRSKKEVLYFIETGMMKKKKNDSDADATPGTDSAATPKRKKFETKAKDSLKNFNFDDVPAKVKWELTDIYEGTWRPLSNGVDRVPESSKQEWSAAFTYLTLQNAGRATFI
ncbi:hypothetical protein BVRB_7g173840 [Beta vulgaris subsp. vulgaris]|nr:hypothetical protein BVRB_7g173840 [Beta vulgaris subsp. vulgaris]